MCTFSNNVGGFLVISVSRNYINKGNKPLPSGQHLSSIAGRKHPISYITIGNCKILKYIFLSYVVASGSEITPCNKIDKPLVVYRILGNVMTSITTLRT